MPITLVDAINNLASTIGNRLGLMSGDITSGQAEAARANNRLDALANTPVNMIHVSSTAKPMSSSLTGLGAGTVTVQASSGDLFSYNTSGGYVTVSRDCICSILGFALSPGSGSTTDIADGNFRALLRTRNNTGGDSKILCDVRSFVRLKKHTISAPLCAMAVLSTGYRISVESCIFDTTRIDGELQLYVVEHPTSIAIPSSITGSISNITNQLASLQMRVALLENQLNP